MGALLGLARGIDRVNLLIGRWAAWLVVAAVLVSAGNATIRKLVNGFPGTAFGDALRGLFSGYNTHANSWLELQWYLFGALVMLGAAAALNRNEHVRVDLIYGAVSDRARLWIDLFGLIFFLLPFAAYAAWLTWPVFLQSWQINEGSSNAGGLVRWPAKLLLPAGFALLALQGLSELIKRIAALRGLITLSTKYSKPLQ
ncbi:TRAP-type mannitol/chloroaromatic compound transport system, small permease component [Paracoccus aminovorans]|uniref:TRAP transporter small permease protein n=1 Tax=Paracoccus aminovorans TaxID=34004 RepID=A0A1I3BRK0_9RHOB|nr:TRAP transporter small permease subunit [Paracoccus aminovorans]CQR86226.1 C4-dicarboxylate ABC transporter [Paracoccus aminovorans]SFH64925.1 TRAP-type mannitol/chloroaromatic compound transport system, small permease component [Paracoccus aminovorans]